MLEYADELAEWNGAASTRLHQAMMGVASSGAGGIRRNEWVRVAPGDAGLSPPYVRCYNDLFYWPYSADLPGVRVFWQDWISPL